MEGGVEQEEPPKNDPMIASAQKEGEVEQSVPLKNGPMIARAHKFRHPQNEYITPVFIIRRLLFVFIPLLAKNLYLL